MDHGQPTWWIGNNNLKDDALQILEKQQPPSHTIGEAINFRSQKGVKVKDNAKVICIPILAELPRPLNQSKLYAIVIRAAGLDFLSQELNARGEVTGEQIKSRG